MRDANITYLVTCLTEQLDRHIQQVIESLCHVIYYIDNDKVHPDCKRCNVGVSLNSRSGCDSLNCELPLVKLRYLPLV
jgi:hypothetical protein